MHFPSTFSIPISLSNEKYNYKPFLPNSLFRLVVKASPWLRTIGPDFGRKSHLRQNWYVIELRIIGPRVSFLVVTTSITIPKAAHKMKTADRTDAQSRRILSSSGTLYDGFWSSEIVKGSVGLYILPAAYLTWQQYHNYFKCSQWWNIMIAFVCDRQKAELFLYFLLTEIPCVQSM